MQVDKFLPLYKKHGKLVCVYFLKSMDNIVYIGSTTHPYNRVYAHTISDKVFDSVEIMPCDIDNRYKVEANEIQKHKPKYNKNMPRPETQIKNAVALNPNIDKLLTEIVNKRTVAHELINSKVGVVAELIMAAHRKEVK